MNDEQHWNQFSRIYVSFFEAQHLPMAQILFDALSIEKAENVLEVGTGSGMNLKHFLIQKPKNCHWVATDICETMLSICQQRIEEFLKNPFEQYEHNYLKEEFPKYEEKELEALNLSIKKANVHDLSQFADNTFDRYYANQVIGNRDDRINILKEALRVLKPEGQIGFTVFGRKENCTWFTIAKTVAIEQGVDPANFPETDEFDKTDKKIILQQLEQVGFKILKNFYVKFPIFNVESTLSKQAIAQKFSKIKIDEAMIEKIFIGVKEKLKKINESQETLTMEACYFIAKKQ